MHDNPMDKLRALLDQVAEQVAKVPGCEVVNSGFAPHDDRRHQPDLMQITVALDPEVAFAPAIPDNVITENEEEFRKEQIGIDAEFNAIVFGGKHEEQKQEMKAKADELRASLEDLKRDDGLGFDG